MLWGKGHQLISAAEIPNVHAFTAAAHYAPILLPSVPWFALALAAGLPGLAVGIMRNRNALLVLVPVAMVTATALIRPACFDGVP